MEGNMGNSCSYPHQDSETIIVKSDIKNFLDSSVQDESLSFTDKAYKMNHSRRGKVIIFNHFRYSCGKGTRTGTEADVRNLRKALPKLGFNPRDIEVYQDLKVSQISKTLKELQKKDHSDNDLLMVFLLTHGKQNDKILAYDAEYSIEKLWEPFRADTCKSLAGKPKIFFVIACRGQSYDFGQRLLAGGESVTEVDSTPIENNNSYLIPVWADFLCIYSTYPDHYSFRNTDDGTWYIQAFCAELSKINASEISFVDFLTAVNGRLSRLFEAKVLNDPSIVVKQTATLTSTLTKRLFFTKSLQTQV